MDAPSSVRCTVVGRTAITTNRLGYCLQCKEKGLAVPAKYRCPACSYVSCSLACSQAHKAADSCTGVRNRAKMVAKRHYNETHLVDDLTLLQDAGRIVGNAEALRTTVTASTRGIGDAKARHLAKAAAAPPRAIRLSFMPRGMARHQRNTTALKSATPARAEAAALPGRHIFYWHLDVYFVARVLGDSQLVKVENCAEDTAMSHILRGALATLTRRAKRRRVGGPSAAAAAAFESCEVGELAVFIQNEYLVPAADATGVADAAGGALNRFTPLQHDTMLHTALKGRAIVEFPVLYVAKKDSPAARALEKAAIGIFERPDPDCISDSDDEESSEDDASASDEEEDEAKDAKDAKDAQS